MDLWIERMMEVNIGSNKKVHVNFYLNVAFHKKPRGMVVNFSGF
jgi:hypothetical protein